MTRIWTVTDLNNALKTMTQGLPAGFAINDNGASLALIIESSDAHSSYLNPHPTDTRRVFLFSTFACRQFVLPVSVFADVVAGNVEAIKRLKTSSADGSADFVLKVAGAMTAGNLFFTGPA